MRKTEFGVFANGATTAALAYAVGAAATSQGSKLQDSRASNELTPGEVDPNGPLSFPQVRNEIAQAWLEGIPGSEFSREQGGWIVKYSGVTKSIRSLFGLENVDVIRWNPGSSRGIFEGPKPIFGDVIGKFHTHPMATIPIGSIPNDINNDVVAYVVARDGVTRINLNNTQNFLGTRKSILGR